MTKERDAAMTIAVFGGSFNPPHRGHLNSALAASRQLKPDEFLVIPDFQPPHKQLAEGSPEPEERLALCRLAFASVPNCTVSDMELRRGGRSYTADTLRALREAQPEAEIILLMGADMYCSLHTWHDADYILRTARIAVFQRAAGEMPAIEAQREALAEKYGTVTELIRSQPMPASSTEIRDALQSRGGVGKLCPEVYAEIIRRRLYGARVNFPWLRKQSYAMLRPRRVPHVQGCEEEAVRLARRWGADTERAAEAAILHDCTKKEQLPEQLRLCRKYGIIPDELERTNGKLLHAKTGAAVAEYEFGSDAEVVEAIRWHTTGRPNMTTLEKVLYMADYMEPTRDFPGVEDLRRLAYKDLDRAMVLGFEMSLADLTSRGEEPHRNTVAALKWYQSKE